MNARFWAGWMALAGVVNIYGVEHEWGIALTNGVSKAVDYSIACAFALVGITLYLVFLYVDERADAKN